MKITKLNKNYLVSLQSLSGGMAGEKKFSHKFEIGKSRIKEIGLLPLVSAHALKGIKYLSENPNKRAQDLMAAFEDKNIKMAISNIGGLDSYKLIPFLNKEIITKNPKPILGYSDTTSLHLFLYTLGIQTYYGPSVLDGFSENQSMHELTLKSVKDILFTNTSQNIISSHEWTSEFLDWANPSLNDVKRKMNKEKHGHIWINFDKNIEGHLLGGCLDTIIQIKNETFFPKLELWEGAIIFLETSEQKMSPKTFEESLVILKQEISVCKGIIFGKPKDEEFFDEYLEIIKKVIDKPLIFNLNFGHTAPMYTLPYGGVIKINKEDKTIFVSK